MELDKKQNSSRSLQWVQRGKFRNSARGLKWVWVWVRGWAWEKSMLPFWWVVGRGLKILPIKKAGTYKECVVLERKIDTKNWVCICVMADRGIRIGDLVRIVLRVEETWDEKISSQSGMPFRWMGLLNKVREDDEIEKATIQWLHGGCAHGRCAGIWTRLLIVIRRWRSKTVYITSVVPAGYSWPWHRDWTGGGVVHKDTLLPAYGLCAER